MPIFAGTNNLIVPGLIWNEWWIPTGQCIKFFLILPHLVSHHQYLAHRLKQIVLKVALPSHFIQDQIHLLHHLLEHIFMTFDVHLQNAVVYLGTPIGNPNYIETALSNAAKQFDIWWKAIQNQLEDLQTKMTLFSKCLLLLITHLLATDVLLHFPFLCDDFDPYHWTSPFLDMLQSSTAAFLAHISGHESNDVSFGTHPWQIVHFSISFGSLGFQDFSVWAVASFVIPFAGAKCHSLEGFSLWNTESLIHPPPALASILSTFQLPQTHKLLPSIPLLLDYYLLTKSKGFWTQ